MGHGTDKQPTPMSGTLDVTSRVIDDLKDRAELHKDKYGTRLKTDNGRNATLDLYQGLLDAAQYAKQMLLENDDPTNLRAMYENLLHVNKNLRAQLERVTMQNDMYLRSAPPWNPDRIRDLEALNTKLRITIEESVREKNMVAAENRTLIIEVNGFRNEAIEARAKLAKLADAYNTDIGAKNGLIAHYQLLNSEKDKTILQLKKKLENIASEVNDG